MWLEFDVCKTKLRIQFCFFFVFFFFESLPLTKTDRLTLTQRIKIIKIYYKTGDSATATYRALRGDDGLHNRQTT